MSDLRGLNHYSSGFFYRKYFACCVCAFVCCSIFWFCWLHITDFFNSFVCFSFFGEFIQFDWSIQMYLHLISTSNDSSECWNGILLLLLLLTVCVYGFCANSLNYWMQVNSTILTMGKNSYNIVITLKFILFLCILFNVKYTFWTVPFYDS